MCPCLHQALMMEGMSLMTEQEEMEKPWMKEEWLEGPLMAEEVMGKTEEPSTM